MIERFSEDAIDISLKTRNSEFDNSWKIKNGKLYSSSLEQFKGSGLSSCIRDSENIKESDSIDSG